MVNKFCMYEYIKREISKLQWYPQNCAIGGQHLCTLHKCCVHAANINNDLSLKVISLFHSCMGLDIIFKHNGLDFDF